MSFKKAVYKIHFVKALHLYITSKLNQFFVSMMGQNRSWKYLTLLPLATKLFRISVNRSFPSNQEISEYEDWLKSKFIEYETVQPALWSDISTLEDLDSTNNPKKSIRWIFLDLHPRETLTSNVIQEMYKSCLQNSRSDAKYLNLLEISKVNFDRFIGDLLAEKKFINFLIFEVHTSAKLNGGRLSPEQFAAYGDSKNLKVMPICFDIFRKFDLDFIHHWESQAAAFLHVDLPSSRSISIRKPIVFWPFIFPLIESPIPNRAYRQLNVNGDTYLFSGSLKNRDRISSLFYIKLGEFKFGFRVRPRVQNRNTDSKMERFEYLNALNSSLGVINFNRKQEMSHPLLTFRAIETILVHGCLLDQNSTISNLSLEQIAVPFKHFIPFKDDLDLMKLCVTLHKNPQYVHSVKENCRNLTKDTLSPDKLWMLLNRIALHCS